LKKPKHLVSPKVKSIICNVCKSDIQKRDCKCAKDTAKHWQVVYD